MSEKPIEFTCEGKKYYQDYLPVADALRLHLRLGKLGFMPLAQALAGWVDNNPDRQIHEVANDEQFVASLVGQALSVIQTLEFDDVQSVRSALESVTYIDAVDGASRPRLDQLPNHFRDARDMRRLYEFLFRGCKAQIGPLFAGMSTDLT